MTTKLTSTDFMMMDIHRPLTNEEVEEVNPQALVDKSARSLTLVDSEAESVGAPHEGATSTRCDVCFAPMPCDKHANVEILCGVTSLDISPTVVLAKAHDAGLTEVVIVGMKADGSEYFASSVSDAAPSMYHLQRGIYKLNKVVDGEHEDENVGPGRPAA